VDLMIAFTGKGGWDPTYQLAGWAPPHQLQRRLGGSHQISYRGGWVSLTIAVKGKAG
jgi:hypothetical protein